MFLSDRTYLFSAVGHYIILKQDPVNTKRLHLFDQRMSEYISWQVQPVSIFNEYVEHSNSDGVPSHLNHLIWISDSSLGRIFDLMEYS